MNGAGGSVSAAPARASFTRKADPRCTFTRKSDARDDELRERNRKAQQGYRDRHGEEVKKARRVASMLMQVLGGRKNVSLLASTITDILPEEKVKLLVKQLRLGRDGIERERKARLDEIFGVLKGRTS